MATHHYIRSANKNPQKVIPDFKGDDEMNAHTGTHLQEVEQENERFLELLQRCETVLTRAMDRASIRDGRALLDDLRKELGK